MSPGVLLSRGPGFSSRCVVSIDTGHIAQSPQSDPRWSSAFKMEPVLFPPSFPALDALTNSMSITRRDILHPGSLTTSLGERHQPLGYKVPSTL